MPRGLKGEKRPADVIGAAVKIVPIATGEETEELDRAESAAAELGAQMGRRGPLRCHQTAGRTLTSGSAASAQGAAPR
jgi:hypothetical protein